MFVCNFEVSLTNYGLPNLAKIRPVTMAKAILVKWKAPKPMKSRYEALTRNLGFMSMLEIELPAMLKAVIMFYLWVSLLSFSASWNKSITNYLFLLAI